MNKSSVKPELLAPAGNLLSGIVAFESGADAVYAGVGRFNARERAENFTIEDMSKLINYAGKHSKKVYLTFNTLIKEEEIEDAAVILADIAELGPDAVIVQDPGMVYLIREFFPSLKIHASTQMAVHNSYGVKAAEMMGIERVILERQVTLQEIGDILRQSPIEIEVFVHGALCCSISGRCLFSSWLGGWSGNRGRCTQPCRRRFYSDNGNGFFFSTKDLGVTELIPELVRMGIASFKIEGRLKKPDYIQTIVTAYREKIDSVSKDTGNIARRAAGRQLSQGFYTEKSMKKLIVPGRMGVTGMLCGKVIATERGGFTASVSKKIHVGDILRIQQYAGDNSTALAVSTVKIDGKIVPGAVKGDICFIKCEREVPLDAAIYKTGESFDKMNAKIANLKPLRKRINLDIRISAEKIEVFSEDGGEWSMPLELQTAQKHPLSPEKVEETFRSSNSDTIEAGEIKVAIDGDYFMPASLLKQARRDFYSHFLRNSQIFTTRIAEKKQNTIKEIREFHSGLKESARSRTNASRKETVRESMDLWAFTPEGKTEVLKKRINNAVKRGIRDFTVTSLFHLPMLSGIRGLNIKIAFPFPVCNSFAVCEISRLTESLCCESDNKAAQAGDSGHSGVLSSVQAWIELEKCAIRSLMEHSPVPVEMITEGFIPILVTRAEIPVEGEIKDDRGAGYYIKKDHNSGLTYLYSDRYFKVEPLKGALSCKLKDNIPVNLSAVSTFNFERELV